MKHLRKITRMPSWAESGTAITAGIVIDFIVAVLAALKPLLAAIDKESST